MPSTSSNRKLTSSDSRWVASLVKEGWRKGPPPSIGWWPASRCGNKHVIRWWDGEQWSQGASRFDSIERAAAHAVCHDSGHVNPPILWLPRPSWWPARSLT